MAFTESGGTEGEIVTHVIVRDSAVVFGWFFFSSRRRHTRFDCDWSSDVCSSDLTETPSFAQLAVAANGALYALYGTPRDVRLAVRPPGATDWRTETVLSRAAASPCGMKRCLSVDPAGALHGLLQDGGPTDAGAGSAGGYLYVRRSPVGAWTIEP